MANEGSRHGVRKRQIPSLLTPRQSPGDAAFERLKRREALKAKDMPAAAEIPSRRVVETCRAAGDDSPGLGRGRNGGGGGRADAINQR